MTVPQHSLYHYQDGSQFDSIADDSGYIHELAPLPDDWNSLVAIPDSVQLSVDTLVEETSSEFVPKELIPRMDKGSDWIILPFIISLILITISRAAYRRRFRYIFLALSSSNNMNILQREGNILSEPVSVLLFGNYAIMISMFFFLLPGIAPGYPPPDLPPWLWFPILLVAVIIFVFIKVSAIYFSGNVFRTSDESSSYLLNLFLVNHVAGVLLWPFMIAVVYIDDARLLWAATAALIILYSIRLGKGLLIGLRKSRFSPVLFLLYLCTLEIIPLLLVVKLVKLILQG